MTAPGRRTPTRRAAAVIAGISAAATFAACSPAADRGPTPAPTSTTAAAAARPVDPCAIVSVDDIDAATGWRLPPGTRPAETAHPRGEVGAVCTWEDAELGGVVQLQVHEGRGATLYAERLADATQSAHRPVRRVAVAGADPAFEVASEGLLGMVVGDDYVQVSIIGGSAGNDDHTQLAATIAKALR